MDHHPLLLGEVQVRRRIAQLIQQYFLLLPPAARPTAHRALLSDPGAQLTPQYLQLSHLREACPTPHHPQLLDPYRTPPTAQPTPQHPQHPQHSHPQQTRKTAKPTSQLSHTHQHQPRKTPGPSFPRAHFTTPRAQLTPQRPQLSHPPQTRKTAKPTIQHPWHSHQQQGTRRISTTIPHAQPISQLPRLQHTHRHQLRRTAKPTPLSHQRQTRRIFTTIPRAQLMHPWKRCRIARSGKARLGFRLGYREEYKIRREVESE